MREGVKVIEAKVDAAIDQVRSDAQALETAARILDNANTRAVPRKAEVVEAIFAMASGMRLAADRIPDSREIPF